MAIQLTPEQEQRIQAVVNAGAYPSTEEPLDAAAAAVEIAAAPGFEGTREEEFYAHHLEENRSYFCCQSVFSPLNPPTSIWDSMR